MEEDIKQTSPVAEKFAQTAVPEEKLKQSLEEKEGVGDDLPPFCLTWTELKLLGIAGVGFFLDGEHDVHNMHRKRLLT
jgi:hypothetical protein